MNNLSLNKQFIRAYYSRLEKTTVISLLFFILFFLLMPKKIDIKLMEPKPLHLSIKIEDVPITIQQVRRGIKKPSRPTIPLPVEDLSVPEDETIDSTVIDLDAGFSLFGKGVLNATKADTVPPRPIRQVIPGYPEEDQKREISGVIGLLIKVNKKGKVVNVVVTSNSTGSVFCEKAAIEAAYQSSYYPAALADKPVEMWTVVEYGFKPN
jgi:TonB family protein